MKKEELNKILDDHKLWVESIGKKGKRAYLKGADLYSADLYNANLYGVNLYGAVLAGANLKGANLYYADLYDANLLGANLLGANLEGANLEGTDLRGAKFTYEIREARNLKFCAITKDQLPWLALHPDFSEFYSTLYVS